MTNSNSNYNSNDKNWEIDNLVNHIISKHHTYVKTTLPILTSSADNLFAGFAENKSELNELKKMLNLLSKEITDHLLKEEETLFPNILDIHQTIKNNSELSPTVVETTINLFSAMNYEHISADKLIANINNTISDFPQESTNNSFSKFKKLMSEFQSDLIEHVRLEDDVLFPLVENSVQKSGYALKSTTPENTIDDLDDDLF